jgi:fructose-bisphosphate aldolase class I
MDRKIDEEYTADYLWHEKKIVPFLKVDKGLAPLSDGVQLLNPIPGLTELLVRAHARHIFGTKMRSVIKEYSETGIQKVVDQQFEIGKTILAAGLVPIIEPEVDIFSENREASETLLKSLIISQLETLSPSEQIMLKLSIPAVDDFYTDLIAHPKVMRVVALSGGYSREDANEKLIRNHGLIASFSRALLEGLSANQTDAEFDALLDDIVDSIYQASLT